MEKPFSGMVKLVTSVFCGGVLYGVGHAAFESFSRHDYALGTIEGIIGVLLAVGYAKMYQTLGRIK